MLTVSQYKIITKVRTLAEISSTSPNFYILSAAQSTS